MYIANKDGGKRRRKHYTQGIFCITVNDDFEDILDTLEDKKEIEKDFEEVSESVSNTKIICYACFLFHHLF